MSFQIFLSDLKKESLTVERLQKVFDNSNYRGKSPLIDPMTVKLYEILNCKAKQQGVPISQVSLTSEHVSRVCTLLVNANIVEKIPPIDPHLVPLPIQVKINDDWRLNEATGLVFRPKSSTTSTDPRQWVATRVMVDNRLYPLGEKHINIAISNGWLFESDRLEPGSCPFQVSE